MVYQTLLLLIRLNSASGGRVSESALVVVDSAEVGSQVAFLFGTDPVIVLSVSEPALLVAIISRLQHGHIFIPISGLVGYFLFLVIFGRVFG